MLAKKTTKIYSVGIYARLSVDGSERKNESIETQLQMAKDFIRQQKDMVLFDCYTDRGKTGTNFAREGFERMMRDVRLRRIDCIIVKDDCVIIELNAESLIKCGFCAVSSIF
ncbi:MAG: recombinase family protein [Lachnospiraceae bacterium]|nr:recombinase family protein [Lachnospiraceae bacterium]MDD7025723.1 recombinase family protein [Lachnospiraceae bacterium]